MVPRIKKDIKSINSERPKIIKSNLSFIVNKPLLLQANSFSSAGKFITGITDFPISGMDYSDWRFKTIAKNYEATYYERWIAFEKDIYFLERIYFHLYKIEDNTRKEFILLHCDSSEPKDSDHSIYKRSPHLHISCAPDPIPHSHFALNNYELEQISNSVENLDKSIMQACKMIREQVLDFVL